MTKAAPLARSGLSEADWLAPVWPNYERSVPMTALMLAPTHSQMSAGAHSVSLLAPKLLTRAMAPPSRRAPVQHCDSSERPCARGDSAQSAAPVDEAPGAGLNETHPDASRRSDAVGRRVERVSVHRNGNMPCMETHRKPGRPSKGHRVTIAGKVPAPIKDAAQQRASELGMSTNDYLASLVSADTGVPLHTERRVGI